MGEQEEGEAFGLLPEELVIQIFCFTNAADHYNLALVNRAFHEYAMDKHAFGDFIDVKSAFFSMRERVSAGSVKQSDASDLLSLAAQEMAQLRRAVKGLERRSEKDFLESVTSVFLAVTKTLPGLLRSKINLPFVWAGLSLLRVLADSHKLRQEDRTRFDGLFAEQLAAVAAVADPDAFEPFVLLDERQLKLRWGELAEEELFDRLVPLAQEVLYRLNAKGNKGYTLVHEALNKTLQREKYESAVPLADMLVTPENPFLDAGLYIEAARAYWGIKNWVKSTELYVTALTKSPECSPGDFADCAYVHLKSKKYEDAVMYYETAIMMEARLDAKHWADYGFVLYQLGNYEGAEEKLAIALQRQPGVPPECYVNYGLILMKLNRFTEAADKFEYAINRSVLEDARAVPFVQDFLDAFHKAEGGPAGYQECVRLCNEKLTQQQPPNNMA